MDETKSKQNAGIEAEEIDAMGQESDERAVKWVKEVEDRQQREEQERVANDQFLLEHKRKFKKNDYYEALLAMAKKELSGYEVPQDYGVDCLLKDDGKLIFGIQKVGYRWYAKGMTICGEPK